VTLKPDVAARVSIGGRLGQRATLSFPDAGMHDLHVLAQGWEDGEERVVKRVRVRECRGRPRLHLSHDFATSEDDVVLFYVDGVEGLTGDVEFRWRVDESPELVTTEGRLRHSVALRDQNGPTTSVVATVEATDAVGNTAKARHAVTINNPLWLMSRSGELRLPVLAERFPRRHGQDFVSDLQVRNPLADTAVEVTGIDVEGKLCADADERRTRWIAAPAALSHSVVAPGQTLRAQITLPQQIGGAAVCTLDVTLVGTTADGRPVRSTFLLEGGIHADRSQPASATVTRMALRAFVEAGVDRVGDDEMKELLGDVRGGYEMLAR
jgi:hypothetical protein